MMIVDDRLSTFERCLFESPQDSSQPSFSHVARLRSERLGMRSLRNTVSHANCTRVDSGPHGTLLTNASDSSGACLCTCAAGFGTLPQQDLFASRVYCNESVSTLSAMGNPATSGALPSTALSSGASLSATGIALVVGCVLGTLLLCYCCYRRVHAQLQPG